MKIALAVAVLFLAGCAHSPFMEPFRTADSRPIPCDKDNCGKLPS